MIQLGGKPPNCPVELIPRANELVIDCLINRNFTYDYLINFLGFDSGLNFYIRLKGGMRKISEIPVSYGIGTGLSFRRFLGVAKTSKTLRRALDNEQKADSTPLDTYLNRKLNNWDFNSSYIYLKPCASLKKRAWRSFFSEFKIKQDAW